jgi:hypothetical protein
LKDETIVGIQEKKPFFNGLSISHLFYVINSQQMKSAVKQGPILILTFATANATSGGLGVPFEG